MTLKLVILVFFGVAIAEGTVFGALTWPVVVTALLIVLLVRPLSGLCAPHTKGISHLKQRCIPEQAA